MPPDCDTRKVVLFYPTESLIEQIGELAARHRSTTVTVSAAVRPRSIRDAADTAVATIIDATEDSARAAKVLSVVLRGVPARRAVVYTETRHPGLELFVRVRGSFLFTGPLTQQQWEDYLKYAAQACGRDPRKLICRPVTRKKHA